MGKPTIATANTDAEFRKQIATRALHDLSFLVASPQREYTAVGDQPGFDVVWNTLTCRIVELLISIQK